MHATRTHAKAREPRGSDQETDRRKKKKKKNMTTTKMSGNAAEEEEEEEGEKKEGKSAQSTGTETIRGAG